MSIHLTIKEKLTTALSPEYFELVNESHMHSVPVNSETHFKVVLVSPVFDGKRNVARHQLIYKLLADELAGPVHALALHTYTTDEWQQRSGSVPDSPDCMGGSNTDE